MGKSVHIYLNDTIIIYISILEFSLQIHFTTISFTNITIAAIPVRLAQLQ